MEMEFYAGSKRNVNKGYWMSFENHSRLEDTKKKVYSRCVPCLEKLYEQLGNAPERLVLDEPLSCWKVVVVLESEEECLSLLEAYQEEKFPLSKSLRGRMGTRDRESPGVVLIFHIHDEEQRDELFADLEKLAKEVNPDYKIFVERGCGDLYGALCGDWNKWQETTAIKNPSIIPFVREKVAKLLRGEYNSSDD